MNKGSALWSSHLRKPLPPNPLSLTITLELGFQREFQGDTNIQSHKHNSIMIFMPDSSRKKFLVWQWNIPQPNSRFELVLSDFQIIILPLIVYYN